MIDALVASRPHACSAARTLESYGQNAALLMHPKGYGVVTLHRPSNVDDPVKLRAMLGVLAEVASRVPLVLALHPRTSANVERFGLNGLLQSAAVAILPPQGYLEMLGLLSEATLVLSDSGGLQEETTALGVPCLTLRENTERPITVEKGTNTIVGIDRTAILTAVSDILAGRGKKGCIPELWDGHAASRIAADLWQWLRNRARDEA
jgi:UDP-N-acetylglucosamine 2-epimerase (non-hydrolysing)